MSISAQDVKTLRERSGSGILDCKKALEASSGDMEAALDWLRTKGLASAAKKSGRTTAEGLIGVVSEGKSAAMVELNSETDFVARNEQFQEFVASVTKSALSKKGDLEATKGVIGDQLTTLISTIGENMALRRVAFLEVSKGVVCHYMHNSVVEGLGKIGVLIALESEAPEDKLQELGFQLAMHIAAARTVAVRREDVPQEVVDHEREVQIAKAKEEGRPADIIEKMIEGRMRKFYEEITLLEQVFVIDGERKIQKVLEQASKDFGTPVEVKAFVRFELGEGVEKEENDFASEVGDVLKS